MLRVALVLRSTEVQPAFLGLVHPIAKDSKPDLCQVLVCNPAAVFDTLLCGVAVCALWLSGFSWWLLELRCPGAELAEEGPRLVRVLKSLAWSMTLPCFMDVAIWFFWGAFPDLARRCFLMPFEPRWPFLQVLEPLLFSIKLPFMD